MKFTPEQSRALNDLFTGVVLGVGLSVSVLVLLSKYKLILIVW